jgi:hypothetical protein
MNDAGERGQADPAIVWIISGLFALELAALLWCLYLP